MIQNLKVNNEIKEKKLSAFRLIREARGISSSELAKQFGVTRSYINCLENEDRLVTHKLFADKFEEMGINWDDYEDLERYINKISKTDLPYEVKHAKALAKAIGVSLPELKKSLKQYTSIPRK